VDVLVDTSVWSLAFRRPAHKLNPAEQRIAASLQDLVTDKRARLIGQVRQELLSGIRDPLQFAKLRDRLRAFPDAPLLLEDFERAADLSNQCRTAGLASSGTDLLICAVAIRLGWQIFTTDADFHHYRKVLPIRLFPERM
jgi:predicted nucleic acid-binding protein